MPPLTTPSYTNEVTPELLHHLDKPAFTKALLASFSAETRALVGQQQVYRAAHPAIGIYRAATEGSRTRNGGMVEKTASPRSYTLSNGEKVRGASLGDQVSYPDGRTATIITGAGHEFDHVALVGSRLCNGDEIIDTRQDLELFVARKGVPEADDFLPGVED
jgi:hypothetical protein